jgi:2-polyprenyl-3-methyl-5-hydroxy-6-metoxy-1,4-benzoquinol methylase
MINYENHRIINQPWPEDDLEYLGSCPLCGSDQRTVLYEGLRDHVFFCALGSWTLHRCEGCNGAYLDPRPTPGTLGKAYEQYFTHETEDQQAPTSLFKRIRQAGMNGYLNSKWETSLSPASRTIAMLLPRSAKALLDGQMMRHLPQPAGGRSLLDVGSGSGHFLSLAQSAGWQVSGIDLDPKAVESARSKGLDVRLGDIKSLNRESDCFDAITISHVIEHVYKPQELLNSCYRLLKSGGYFWIETPNIDSYGHSEFKGDWRGLEPPRHLQLLSWPLLQRMLDKAGFIQITQAYWRPEFLSIYYASKAIQCSLELAKMKPSCMGRIMSHFVESSNRISHTRREFITLQAIK